MIPPEEITAIQAFGYTPREASFIVTAALHSGYFLRRQFDAHRGKRANQFCTKLLRNEHAKATVYAQGTQLFHLCAKPLYRALGQDDNRHRRQQDPFSLRAKLIGLDYVLTRPDLQFLPTERSKIEYFVGKRNVPSHILPRKTYTGKAASHTTTRFFIEKYPVWIDPVSNHVGFAYIDDGVFSPPSFPTWLLQHHPLITEIGAVDVVYLSITPAGFGAGARAWARIFSTLEGAQPPEIKAYFELRSDIETRGLGGRSQEELDRYRKLTRRFAEAKFHEQYEAWKAAAQQTKPGSIPTKSAVSGPAFSAHLMGHSYQVFGPEKGAKR